LSNDAVSRSAVHQHPRALLVDLNDTLEDDSVIPEFIKRVCELVAAADPRLDAAALFDANAKVWDEYWPQIEQDHWLGRTDMATTSREAWRRALRTLGVDDESIVEFAYEQTRKLDRETRRRYPDVVDLLSAVAELKLKLALVTNGPSDLQRDRVTSLGLDDVLDAVIISAEIGVAKPDPRPFLLAIEQLNVEPSEAWHVGDSLASDVAGALAAGVTAVWLNRDGIVREIDDPRPDLEVTSLLELADVLRAPETRSDVHA
jgi:2-haloalkanoic acid dehalogenase type II